MSCLYVFDGGQDLAGASSLHHAHEHQEHNRIPNRADSHAVDEPLQQRVPLVQPPAAAAHLTATHGHQSADGLLALHRPAFRQVRVVQ